MYCRPNPVAAKSGRKYALFIITYSLKTFQLHSISTELPSPPRVWPQRGWPMCASESLDSLRTLDAHSHHGLTCCDSVAPCPPTSLFISTTYGAPRLNQCNRRTGHPGLSIRKSLAG